MIFLSIWETFDRLYALIIGDYIKIMIVECVMRNVCMFTELKKGITEVKG